MNFYAEREKAKRSVAAYLTACAETDSLPSFKKLRQLMSNKYPFGERFIKNLLSDLGMTVNHVGVIVNE
jgi:hypothetical protein